MAEDLLMTNGTSPNAEFDPLNINHVREKLQESNEMAVGHLCYAGLQHASESISHTDQKIAVAFTNVTTMSEQDKSALLFQVQQAAMEVRVWMRANVLKTILMVIGLGGTMFWAKAIGKFIILKAASFIDWGRSTTTAIRFLGFVGLMMIRLVVSALVPPTSPAFGIILQAATPDGEKWTAMPFFLVASAVAGAVPYLMDKILQVFCRQDFLFSKCMLWFSDTWPLTCWTGPAMRKVFRSVGGDKMGASLAVIVGHAAPFMGAQTTNMQRVFLPNPWDTIISQPFGMSEDLLGMAMAEATSSPTLASVSLTLLITGFNLGQFAVFSQRKDRKAFTAAFLNLTIGCIIAYMLFQGATTSASAAFVMVGVQMLIQLLVIPKIAGILSGPMISAEHATDREITGSSGTDDAVTNNQTSATNEPA